MPFHAESAIASLVKRTQERAVPLVEVDAAIPPALSNIVSKCLERDPRRALRLGAGTDRRAGDLAGQEAA